MKPEKKLVEVAVKSDGGERVPVGIMNTKQALSLPEEMEIEVANPDKEAGATDYFIGREELKAKTRSKK